jgi:hypothetical protein
MLAAGETAIGFICATWAGTGTHFPLIQEVRQYVLIFPFDAFVQC